MNMNIYILILGSLFIVYGLSRFLFDRRRGRKSDFFLRRNSWIIALIGVAVLAAYAAVRCLR